MEKPDLIFDQNNIWHPYTSLTNPLPTYPISKAEGVRLMLDDDRELIDGMSSWWTAIHGYNVPEINKAAKEQLEKMAHVMFGGITHQPAIDLCKKLVDITPEGLNKVFLADSGSVSTEVAMKMAIQYQHAKGKKAAKFLTLSKGYHGDTTGAMSVCDPVGGMHHLFSEFLPKHEFFDIPTYGFENEPSKKELTLLKEFFEKNAKDSAAFILEPIVQGAGGMNFYSPIYLKEIRRLCEEFQILLIADEIATGFGRSGELFACNHANITPDIMCLGKALTGGYMTLAATICKTEVSEAICNGEAGVFMHGPTFMGNPLACAVSNKSLELLLSSDWKSNVKRIETQLKEELGKINSEKVSEVRVLGAIGVVETKENVDVPHAQKFFVENGVWIRPFRNLIYIMPPYVIEKEDLSTLTGGIRSYLEKH